MNKIVTAVLVAVLLVGPHLLALLAHDDGRSGVLARGEDLAGRDARVLEELSRDEAIVVRRLGVAQDVGPSAELVVAEEVLDVDDALMRESGEGALLDAENLLRLAAGERDFENIGEVAVNFFPRRWGEADGGAVGLRCSLEHGREGEGRALGGGRKMLEQVLGVCCGIFNSVGDSTR